MDTQHSQPNLVLFINPKEPSNRETRTRIEQCIKNKPDFLLKVVDITQDEILMKAFSTFVPALAIDGRVIFYGKIPTYKLRWTLINKSASIHLKALLSSISK